MKAVGYCRISKEDESSVSLDYQKAEIKKLCKREGLRLISLEVDNGISGKSIKNRPAVQRVLNLVDTRQVDAVIVYRSDRLSRDGLESLQTETLFIEKGIRYISATEGCLNSEDLDAELMRYLRAGLNSRERRIISLRTRAALQRKRERGERIGGRPKYGWKVSNGKLVKDAQEQRVILQIKILREREFSVRAIRDVLCDMGTLTRIGTPFSQSQIVRILQG
ncbi:recombinase family protein [Desulfomonile tiedjei]|uniref:Site-specific recombinase, DNA invertase Pin n=1 Tax=Desulfomonile tiedjei (strain ATCC 49306 / DSM 6799 / DCB-1) TaxID=706587 RepID=I4C8Y6_DESTA|nr:recombinase family protein [Desulfomonile tiedjei]AFM26027.1 site-specific recombinase, DNA invertase Pin [Desulfomonile tiedjei DSM 6799]